MPSRPPSTSVKKQPLVRRPWFKRVSFLVGLVLIVGLAGWWLVEQRKLAGVPEDLRGAVKNGKVQVTVLNATVQWTADAFVVRNQEDRPWANCAFELNRGTRNDVYVFRQDAVAAQTSLRIPHASFVNGSGAAFSYPAVTPQHFLIRCSNVGGKVGLYNGVPKQ